MMVTATKVEVSTATSDTAHGGSHNVDRAPGRSLKPKPEPSLPELCSARGNYLPAQKTLLTVERIVDPPTGDHVMARGPIEAISCAERPKTTLPSALIPTAAGIARRKLSVKAFTMHLEHLDFLKQVSTGERPPITAETAFLASKAWQLIWKASDYKMPVPAACTGPDGRMFYSWDRGRHHLELEIIPGQPAEFFYRDRETEQLWGEDYRIGDTLSSEAIAKLRFFR
jgi:hypothetical protein